MDARGIQRRARPLPRKRPWTPVDVSGVQVKPIRNQQVGGSSPPVGSSNSRHLRACSGRPSDSNPGRCGGHLRVGSAPHLTCGTRSSYDPLLNSRLFPDAGEVEARRVSLAALEPQQLLEHSHSIQRIRVWMSNDRTGFDSFGIGGTCPSEFPGDGIDHLLVREIYQLLS